MGQFTDVVIERASAEDSSRIAALRQLWTEERAEGSIVDPAFADRLAGWLLNEGRGRLFLLASVVGVDVGMVNLFVFERMPQPGRSPSRWCYLANLFVPAGQRNRGIGTALVEAAIGEARSLGAARIVLSPSEESASLCVRAGFGPADELMSLTLA